MHRYMILKILQIKIWKNHIEPWQYSTGRFRFFCAVKLLFKSHFSINSILFLIPSLISFINVTNSFFVCFFLICVFFFPFSLFTLNAHYFFSISFSFGRYRPDDNPLIAMCVNWCIKKVQSCRISTYSLLASSRGANLVYIIHISSVCTSSVSSA